MSNIKNVVFFCEQYKKAALNLIKTQSSESDGISDKKSTKGHPTDSGVEFFTDCHITLIIHK